MTTFHNFMLKFELGLPCVLKGEVLVRIIGEGPAGSWHEGVYSVPRVCTPHGTVIDTGVAFLERCSEEQLEALKDLEQEAQEDEGKVYGGYLSELFPSWADRYFPDQIERL